MNLIQLTRNWSEFKGSLDGFINEANAIEDKYEKAQSEEAYNNLSTEYSEWYKKVLDNLADSFDEKDNEFVQEFRPQTIRYNLGTHKKDSKQRIKDKIEDLSSLKNVLEYYPRILAISDAIISRDTINLEERKNFSTDETLELILEKLYELYDDSYHPVSSILWGNGIVVKRVDEPRQLVKTLENYGYVNALHTKDVQAQLTIDGKRYVESNRKSDTTDYSKIDKSQEELNAKIDEIIEALRQQGAGQEVLFDELEELKHLYTTLNKKNWGQVLKGKLIDLGLSQLISTEVMQGIFKELTDQVLKLK